MSPLFTPFLLEILHFPKRYLLTVEQLCLFFHSINYYTGGILFNPDLAVEEVFSRVELHFLILIFENHFSGHFTTQMANSLFNPDFILLFNPFSAIPPKISTSNQNPD